MRCASPFLVSTQLAGHTVLRHATPCCVAPCRTVLRVSVYAASVLWSPLQEGHAVLGLPPPCRAVLPASIYAASVL